jgi:IclR family acetate operon transcriptional repressor
MLTPVQLAQRTGLNVSLVSHSVDLLAEQDVLSSHDDGSYSLGLHIAALAARLPQIERLRTIARPRLVQLRERTGETANLLIRDGDDVIYLDQVESLHALRHTGWAGRSIPLSISAAGQALVDPSRVHVVLDAVEPGVTAIASAVDVELEQPVAISITGPTVRLPPPVIDTCQAAIAEAATAIGRDMLATRFSSGDGSLGAK